MPTACEAKLAAERCSDPAPVRSVVLGLLSLLGRQQRLKEMPGVASPNNRSMQIEGSCPPDRGVSRKCHFALSCTSKPARPEYATPVLVDCLTR